MVTMFLTSPVHQTGFLVTFKCSSQIRLFHHIQTTFVVVTGTLLPHLFVYSILAAFLFHYPKKHSFYILLFFITSNYRCLKPFMIFPCVSSTSFINSPPFRLFFVSFPPTSLSINGSFLNNRHRHHWGYARREILIHFRCGNHRSVSTGDYLIIYLFLTSPDSSQMHRFYILFFF